MSTVPVEVDAELLKLADAQAANSGRARGDVLAAALRRGLGGGRLSQILSTSGQDASLSEEEAMALAKSELEAARAQRQGA
ncbi:hypothetical protein [Jatrophihabitans endophyticus]|uniref:hypothetical protein n=1 Tax=Jatrophihabitans endophyticus TaxID=1206085 RepID=UPI001A0D0F6B|nr:hypothetical protein [Jatrophihabitans endophyticus]MBE7188190.1 hypothetical protein [Jatrophihabitans endophyticus]